ncbi:hypothetical protein C8Q77DRAFT_467365 [Trametes polyzona]|nr:hypothetical protein C8Q77DRAFT_467365 [Trametes polyzona]
MSLPGESSSPSRERRDRQQTRKIQETLANPRLEAAKRSGLVCGGCGGAIIGRIVSTMDMQWHPGCFRCCVCDELLENLSLYAHSGRPYCHLDYHEKFAPRCYHCQTAIVDERFITLDDPELGKRTYHEQHFCCAECGDPFLPPSAPGAPSRTFAGDGEFAVGTEDDVGFTVYRGHPYCEACHVRLRMPKCKRCKKSIRDGMQAVEALGGKWCWECFTCAVHLHSPRFVQGRAELMMYAVDVPPVRSVDLAVPTWPWALELGIGLKSRAADAPATCQRSAGTRSTAAATATSAA